MTLIGVQLAFDGPDVAVAAQAFVVAENMTWTCLIPPGAASVRITPVVEQRPPTPPTTSAGFRAYVLSWLREEAGISTAASVENVFCYGTDWAGDTPSGFYSEFDMGIDYTDADGSLHRKNINATGEEIASLWRWVIGGWPEHEEGEDPE